MNHKIVELEGIGTVHLYKRKGSRSIRLSFMPTGEVRVSVPYWVPYQAGVSFAMARAEWIIKNRPAGSALLKHGDRIGKAHRLVFAQREVAQPRATLGTNQITVAYAAVMSPSHPSVQKAAQSAANRALKREAENLLPQRLRALAAANGYNFKSVTVKRLKARWGSCNQHKEIVLNFYLMQLPWQLIDYVLLHELTHTEHLNHSAAFWSRFERAMPGAKQLKKLLHAYQPVVIPQS
jgi:predicted metal-dependent hydrolase